MEFRETNMEERSFSWKETRGRGHCVLAQFVEFTGGNDDKYPGCSLSRKMPGSTRKTVASVRLSVAAVLRYFSFIL